MRGIVDRIEGGVIILEIDGKYKDIPLEKFPKDISEGDIVIYDNGYKILREETNKRKNEMRKLLRSLFDENKE